MQIKYRFDKETVVKVAKGAAIAPAGAGGGEETPAPTQEIIWFSED